MTAGRARGVRSEPRVDAGDMKGVATLREHTDLVGDGELSEADGAVGELGSQFGSEGELWEVAEDLLLEALVGWRRRRSVRGSGGGASGGEAAEPGATSHGHQTKHADEGAEKGREDYHEV